MTLLLELFFFFFCQFTWKRKSKISPTLGYTSELDDLNSFIRCRVTAKCNDFRSLFGNEIHSKPSYATLPTLPNIALAERKKTVDITYKSHSLTHTWERYWFSSQTHITTLWPNLSNHVFLTNSICFDIERILIRYWMCCFSRYWKINLIWFEDILYHAVACLIKILYLCRSSGLYSFIFFYSKSHGISGALLIISRITVGLVEGCCQFNTADWWRKERYW